MSEWRPVAELSAFAGTNMVPLRIGELRLLLYKTSSGLYATARRCTHQAADLMRGYLDGDVIECPVHQGRFDIRTGKALSAPACEPLVTYEVRIVAERIELKIS
ncbi:MAG TPA: non-heme iron oxygenase ferredoxin subunit [Steroidobacteraceae bacterium]